MPGSSRSRRPGTSFRSGGDYGAATLPPVDNWPIVAIKLDAAEASKVVEILVHLAALIDPGGLPGLLNAFGQRDERLDPHALTDTQFKLLSHDPGHQSAERSEVAAYLRTIWTKIEDQLPPEAPEIRLGGPR